MYWIITKYLITAGIVVFISEVAKRSDRLGAFIGALPTVTILALIWMYIEKQPAEKLTHHAFYTFWYVLPSLPMLLIFPYLYGRFSFLISLVSCLAITILCFLLVIWIANLFGVQLV
ncbi:DUF3147 family protein [Vibrio nitrifigilis]|uniref:DUF3147 family protein n=1 Tax=Vibrio nitrifigilis TaxID=2789781 RepID=A0ABS0GKF6_9VIBR|nr:DUF3147 family protein [Vibrio nitrifigilis]MBF9002949.1 DUF3147 family protein [Vibrio nitrifigilis]